MKVAKGINVRSKGGKFFVFINCKGQRFAFQYDTEGQAETVAKAFAEAKNKGQLDAMIAGMKPVKADEVAASVSAPASPTLRAYYTRRFEKRIRLKVRPSTLGIYVNAFENHLFPA